MKLHKKIVYSLAKFKHVTAIFVHKACMFEMSYIHHCFEENIQVKISALPGKEF